MLSIVCTRLAVLIEGLDNMDATWVHSLIGLIGYIQASLLSINSYSQLKSPQKHVGKFVLRMSLNMGNISL